MDRNPFSTITLIPFIQGLPIFSEYFQSVNRKKRKKDFSYIPKWNDKKPKTIK